MALKKARLEAEGQYLQSLVDRGFKPDVVFADHDVLFLNTTADVWAQNGGR
jgi:hypothetical protein